MKDCANDLISFHNDEVTLSEPQRANMRERRNANRNRLKSGLGKMERKGPDEYVIQGSYAMKTMVKHPENGYDIDDGAAFLPEQLKLSSGRDMTAAEAKSMVKEALMKDERLPSEPKILKNCVRVEYEGGYHVDIPVYRSKKSFLGATTFEIAGTDWRKTNPRELTEWFEDRVAATKSETDGDPQLRRMVRLMKKYARVNCGDADAPSGLILTVLVDEAHRANQPREDKAFREVLERVKTRIEGNWHVLNPRDASEELTKPIDQGRLAKLSEKIGRTLQKLAVLDDTSCSRALARSTWDETFKTEYFSNLEKSERSRETTAVKSPDRPVNKQGGGTYA